MSSMITTAAWVPRGFAAPFPTKYDFDDEEFERIAELAKLQLDDANDDLDEAQEEEASAEANAAGNGTAATSTPAEKTDEKTTEA